MLFELKATRFILPALLLGALGAARALLASADDGPQLPKGFQHWYFANSMLATKEPNQSGLVSGFHLIYVNPKGLDRFRRGGADPYPDGTVLLDDVRDFSVTDGVYQEGARKAIPVMVKDSKKYASTGGWGFQAWAGGDASKPIVKDATKQCFGCHMSRKTNDYVFSTSIK